MLRLIRTVKIKNMKNLLAYLGAKNFTTYQKLSRRKKSINIPIALIKPF